MALRRPRIFKPKDSAGDVPLNPYALQWGRVLEAREASQQLIGYMYGLVNQVLLQLDVDPTSTSKEPDVRVLGHPASNELTYRTDSFSLTRTRRWLESAENKQENMHQNGLKFRRYVGPRNALVNKGWWEVDVRESGVMRISTSNYPAAEEKLASIYDDITDRLKNEPTAYNFGVRHMGFNKGETALQFGLSRTSRTELYLPASIVRENDALREHIDEEIGIALAELPGLETFDMSRLDDKIN